MSKISGAIKKDRNITDHKLHKPGSKKSKVVKQEEKTEVKHGVSERSKIVSIFFYVCLMVTKTTINSLLVKRVSYIIAFKIT